MNIFKKSAKLVSLLVALTFATVSTVGCVDDSSVEGSKQIAVVVAEEAVEGAVCEDCESGADDAALDLELALDEFDLPYDDVIEESEEPVFALLSNPVKICKALLDLKKAVEAMRKANKAYKAWKAATTATKCVKAGIALTELGAAVAIIVVAIDSLLEKEKKCGLTDAEKQMLEDLKKGQQKIEDMLKDQALKDSAQQCPVPPGPAPAPTPMPGK